MPKPTQRAAKRARRLSFFGLISLLSAYFLLVQTPIRLQARARGQVKLAQPLKQDDSCLACHGQPGMTSGSGKSISIDPGKHAASVHGTLGCTDCHATIKDYPHPAKIARVKCATCHADQAARVPTSIHGTLGEAACQSCHGDPHEVAAAALLTPAMCAQCHADEVKDFGKASTDKPPPPATGTPRPVSPATEPCIKFRLRVLPPPQSQRKICLTLAPPVTATHSF